LSAIVCSIQLCCGLEAVYANVPEQTLLREQPMAPTGVVHFSAQPVGRLILQKRVQLKSGRMAWTDVKNAQAQGDLVLEKAPIYSLKLGYHGMEDLSFLKNLGPMLRELDLNDFPFTDKQAYAFRYVPNLEDLRADRTELTDEGVKQLACLKKLNWLFLSKGAYSGKSLQVFGRMSNLRTLDISHNNLDDAALANLNTLHELFKLRLTSCRIGDGGVAHLAVLSKLELLHLGKNKQVTDKSVSLIGTLKELRDLDLSDTSVTSKCIPALQRLTHLKRLAVNERQFQPGGKDALVKALPGVVVSTNSDTMPIELFAPLHPTFDPQLSKPLH
jgi:hypothetical protein